MLATALHLALLALAVLGTSILVIIGLDLLTPLGPPFVPVPVLVVAPLATSPLVALWHTSLPTHTPVTPIGVTFTHVGSEGVSTWSGVHTTVRSLGTLNH